MYFDLESERDFSLEELRSAPPEQQRSVMEQWFRAQFEDPAERTPYESAEGGYIWIWGGPYDARNELLDEFGEAVPEEVIDALADSLEDECAEWAPTVRAGDYDDFVIRDIAGITTYYHTFSGAILDIEALMQLQVPGPQSGVLARLLYVNVITALETYLSDAFINTVFSDPRLLRAFVESAPEFRSQKIPVAEVFSALEQVEDRVRAYLADVVWHRIERIKQMYKDTLGIAFPDDLTPVFKAVLTRHDIVHRNGRTKQGKEIVITLADVRGLIASVEGVVQHIDGALSQFKKQTAGESP